MCAAFEEIIDRLKCLTIKHSSVLTVAHGKPRRGGLADESLLRSTTGCVPSAFGDDSRLRRQQRLIRAGEEEKRVQGPNVATLDS